MTENSPFYFSFPCISSSSTLQSSNDISTSESPTKSDSKSNEIIGIDEMKLQIADLKETIEKQQQTIKQQNEIIDKQKADIDQLQKNREKEKAEIVTQNGELKIAFDEQQQTIDYLNVTLQKYQTQFRQKHYQIVELKDKLGYLIKPNRICKLSDAVNGGKIDKKLLNGKVLVVNNLQFDAINWLADDKKITFKDSNFQICITNKLSAIRVNLSPIINRIFYSTIKELYLADVTITFYEYKEVTAQCRNIQLYGITVKDKYGNEMKVFDLLKAVAATIEMFKYVFKLDELISGTAQKLADLLPFPNLRKFYLWDIHEGFDLLTFGEFIYKNPKVDYWLDFKCSKKFFDVIRSLKDELKQTLPTTCRLQISRYS